MSKITMTAAVALALAAAAPTVYAQTSHETRALTTNTVTSTVIQPDEVRASKIIGSTVYDVQNRNIGSVKDLVLNKDGKVDAAVLDVGSFLGMGGKYVAVPIPAAIERPRQVPHSPKGVVPPRS